MSLVTLVSGGVDSALMALLANDEGLVQHPLFIDYGQRAGKLEWMACQKVFRAHGLPRATRMNLSGFGRNVPSGLTRRDQDVFDDAFLPGRNLLFLLAGAAFASRRGAQAVAIGLLNEQQSLFPDQSRDFLARAEGLLRIATSSSVRIIAPLIDLDKAAVLKLAEQRGIRSTYSCHSGTVRPCGRCVSCRERAAAQNEGGNHGR